MRDVLALENNVWSQTEVKIIYVFPIYATREKKKRKEKIFLFIW